MAPSPVAYPLGPPTVDGNEITVDTMLNQPTRITRMISDLTLQRFIADRIFSNAGGVTGGALIFDEVQENELYGERDVERVAPGGEFPIVGDARLAPKVATVEKYGGKVFITDEARDRNNSTAFTNQIRKLGNMVVRKINARTIEALNASIAASGRTFVGNDWSAVIPDGNAPTPPADQPIADFGSAWLTNEQDELGVTFDTWLINPQEYLSLVLAYGDKLGKILEQFDIELYTSNRVTAGTALAVAAGQVGEMRIEKPLGTETWREQKTERTWVQSSVRPLFAVTNPFAVMEVTGLAGA